MKKLLVGLFMMFVGVASATTINLSWMVDNNTYAQTTCESGGNLNIPSTTPTKRGYHFVGWEPINYTELEYIESTGTQYIDTGLMAGANDTSAVWGFDIRFALMSDVAEAEMVASKKAWILGVFTNDAENSILYAPSPTSLIIDGRRIDGRDNQGLSLYDFHTTSVKNGNFFQDNELVGTYVPAPSTISDRTVWLFALSQTIPMYAKVKIQSVVFYNRNGSEIQNLIPARRNSDNVVGMYDTVTGTFFTNQGTGDFIAGPVSANQTLE